MLKLIKSFLGAPVHISSLVLFRILFGFCMVLNVYYYTPEDVLINQYVLPKIFFSFEIFKWLHLPILDYSGFSLLFSIMGIASYFVMIGLFYRLSLIVLLLLQLYLGLLEKSYFVDLSYLYILITFLMIFTQANRKFAMDVCINKKIQSDFVPTFCVLILQLQFVIVYFYSGISKITYPDWLQAKQMLIWLPTLKDLAFVGSIFQYKATAYLMSYGGIFFDLSIGFLLMSKRTRKIAIPMVICFHLFTKLLLDLDLVPWFFLATTVLFLEPDTPHKFIEKIRSKVNLKPSLDPEIKVQKTTFSTLMTGLFIIYLLIQLLLPLRSFLRPGSVSWTKEGLRFSWHLMNDNITSQMVVYYTSSPNAACVNPQPIGATQTWMMSVEPNMILQYVHYLRDELKRCGVKDPEIYVDSKNDLNRRGFYPLINPKVNLANKNYPSNRTPEWIMPHPDQQKEGW